MAELYQPVDPIPECHIQRRHQAQDKVRQWYWIERNAPRHINNLVADFAKALDHLYAQGQRTDK